MNLRFITLALIWGVCGLEGLAQAQPYAITGSILFHRGISEGGAFKVTGAIGLPTSGELSGGPYTFQGDFIGELVTRSIPDAPMLTAYRSGINIVLSWPVSTDNFIVEETASLLAPVQWSPVQVVPVVANHQTQVTLPLTKGPRFYRMVWKISP